MIAVCDKNAYSPSSKEIHTFPCAPWITDTARLTLLKHTHILSHTFYPSHKYFGILGYVWFDWKAPIVRAIRANWVWWSESTRFLVIRAACFFFIKHFILLCVYVYVLLIIGAPHIVIVKGDAFHKQGTSFF